MKKPHPIRPDEAYSYQRQEDLITAHLLPQHARTGIGTLTHFRALVAKASSGQTPLPFWISEMKERGAKIVE
jgi:hypothetical protein